MNIRERKSIYAVPLIGGLLCSMTVFSPYFYLSFRIIFAFVASLIEVVCGIIMLFSAIRLKRGKSMWIKEQTRILISSWSAFSVSLITSFYFMLGIGYFFIFYEFGFVGSVISITGFYFHKYIKPKFCPYCEFKLEKWSFDYCPNCNSPLSWRKTLNV